MQLTNSMRASTSCSWGVVQDTFGGRGGQGPPETSMWRDCHEKTGHSYQAFSKYSELTSQGQSGHKGWL